MADAGTVTVTQIRDNKTIKHITFDWLSDALGASDKQTTYSYDGQLLRVVISPDTGGTIPSNSYKVELCDEDGFDLLNAQAAVCDNTLTYQFIQSMLPPILGKIYLHVTAAGAAKGGTVHVYLR